MSGRMRSPGWLVRRAGPGPGRSCCLLPSKMAVLSCPGLGVSRWYRGAEVSATRPPPAVYITHIFLSSYLQGSVMSAHLAKWSHHCLPHKS